MREHIPGVLIGGAGIVIAAIFRTQTGVITVVGLVCALYALVAYWRELRTLRVRLQWALAGWAMSVLVMVVLIWAVFGGREVTMTIKAVTVGAADSCSTPLPDGSVVVVTASVKNTGPPTIVEYGKLRALLPSGESVEGRQQEISGALYIGLTRTRQVASFSGEDALYRKTTEAPIVTGAQVVGILAYFVKDVAAEDLMKPGTRFIVEYKDVSERSREAELAWAASSPLKKARSCYIAFHEAEVADGIGQTRG